MRRALLLFLVGCSPTQAPKAPRPPSRPSIVHHAPRDVFRACQTNAPACHHALRHTDCNMHEVACLDVYEADFDGDGQREIVVHWFGGVRIYAADGPGCPTEGDFTHPDCGAQLSGRGIDSEPDQTRWAGARAVGLREVDGRPVLDLALEDGDRQWRETLFFDGDWRLIVAGE